MQKFTCERCNFSTNHKPNYKRHLNTKKHNNITPKSPICHHLAENCHQFVTPKSPICHPKVTNLSPQIGKRTKKE